MPCFQLPPLRSIFCCCCLVCLLIIMQSSHISAAGYEFVWSDCPTDANYTTNSTYQSNLNSLLSSLSSAAATTGYYNNTTGQRPNQVYGLAQCRGDESPDDCRSCLKTATQNIVQRCPKGQNSAVFYDECFLRYSNQSFFSPNSTGEKYDVYMCNSQNASNPELFGNLLGNMMDNLTTQASTSSRKYADAVVTNSATTLYGLMQCTRDLSQATCDGCLKDLRGKITKSCGQKKGGRIFGFNCYLRYELYPFYNISVDHPEITLAPAPAPMLLASSPASTPPLPSPPTTNVVTGTPQGSNTTGEKSNSHRTWVLPLFLIVIIEVTVFAFV